MCRPILWPRSRVPYSFISQTTSLRLQQKCISSNSAIPSIDPLALVSRELGNLRSSVQSLVNSDRPSLNSVAHYYFKGSGGKGVRPGIVLLMSRATNNTPNSQQPTTETDKQTRLAEITELIHVASLLHDDVIDHASSRRSLPSAPHQYGNKLTVLGGDFLLARASLYLARLGHLQVVELMASALADLVEGEVLQMQDETTSREEQWQAYERKTFLKTAALIAKSAKSAVLLGGGDETAQEAAFQFGRHLGLAFQLTDDLLDYTQPASQLGKPASADLSLGLATAPVLFAAEEHAQLRELIARRFNQQGDVSLAESLVRNSQGMDRTADLAKHHGQKAIDALAVLRDSDARRSLEQMTRDVLTRKK